MRNAYTIFFGKPEGKRPMCRWEDNIRIDLMEVSVARCGLDSSDSGWRPIAGCCEHGNATSGSIKGGNFLTS
jgi:hypothetical protein